MAFTDALALNNHAVALLRNGQGEDAMYVFETAWMNLSASFPRPIDHAIAMHQCQMPHDYENTIASVRQARYEQNRISPCEPSIRSEAEPIFPSVLFSVNLGDTDLITLADDNDLKASPSNFFSVYKRAIGFDIQGDPTLCRLVRCAQYLPSTILYNAGLVFHMNALRYGSSSNFLRALEFYTLAEGSLKQAAKQYGLYTIEIDLLMLAITNNAGHCHSHFNNVNESRACFEYMTAIIDRSDGNVLLANSEYFFFHIHILLGSCWMPVLAPAA